MARVVVTGTGAICGLGKSPAEILDAVRAGRSAIGPIRQWDASRWPVRQAAEVADFNPNVLLNDRKLFKLIRRTDVFGIYAAGQAIEAAGLAAYRDGLDPEAAARFNDATGVYVGSGGGAYANQYDYLPLLAVAGGSLPVFGRELGATVTPMWLLRSLPNNVLCHVGIRHGLKGPNACITNHSISGALAIVEAAQALATGECERAVAAGHDASIEPQMMLYYHGVGLMSGDALRPFDAGRSGSAMGEGAAALVLERADAAAARGAPVLGEILGSGCASEGEGLLPIRADGNGLARAIALAFEDAGLAAADVGMIVAHGNGTRSGDASEARALQTMFGAALPPVTAFKWAFGHLLAASAIIETVLAIAALRERTAPGIATLERLDPACAGLSVSASAQAPRGDVALVLSRGFGGTNAALLVRAAAG
ncbi:MAG: beta-ketoacyl-[acyl-carrier-protein] synthase family protein [Bacteroidota bacterium]